MNQLNVEDRQLIEAARTAIDRNYDEKQHYHAVGAAVRCKNGKVYTGVNCDNIHGSCAEFIAMGGAISAGEREFDTIVAVFGRGDKGRVVPPCGNCRQMLFEYAPGIQVIIEYDGVTGKLPIEELLPYPYVFSGYDD